MSGPLTELCEGFAAYLAAQDATLTWAKDGNYTADQTGLFVLAVPPAPDRLVTLTPYPLGDDPTLANSTVGLQVRTRAPGDPRDVLDLDDQLADVLLGNFPLKLANDVQITTLIRTSAVSLGEDTATPNRWGFTANYRLTVYRPGPHRH